MKKALLVLLAGSLVMGGAAQAGKTAKKPVKKVAKAETVTCPVMGSKFKPTAKTEKSTYKGKTYFFCCAGCKPEFDKNPAKYTKAADTKKKDKKAEAKPVAKTLVKAVSHKAAAHEDVLTCPVTGEKIVDKAKAAGHSDYEGKTYYFCCAGCKPEFDKDPAKFITKK